MSLGAAAGVPPRLVSKLAPNLRADFASGSSSPHAAPLRVAPTVAPERIECANTRGKGSIAARRSVDEHAGIAQGQR